MSPLNFHINVHTLSIIKKDLTDSKVAPKYKKDEPLFKYQSRIYNVQRNSDISHRGMTMIWKNKPFLPLNVIKGKISTCGSKGILRHYHSCSDPKLGPGIFTTRIIPFSFHACTTILSVS